MRKVSRREFVYGTGSAIAGFAIGFAARPFVSLSSQITQTRPSTPDQALQGLLDGNSRFVSGSVLHPDQSAERRTELASGQHPWAVILGCVDSRVPPEIVFDLGLGDAFTSRTAGQVIDNAVMGSVEFAVEEGGMLLMVLGHQACGAVKATISAIQSGTHAEGQIDYLVEAIKPAVESALTQPGDLLENSVRANIAMQVTYLSSSSNIISHALIAGTLKIVGARYDLSTGQVTIMPS